MQNLKRDEMTANGPINLPIPSDLSIEAVDQARELAGTNGQFMFAIINVPSQTLTEACIISKEREFFFPNINTTYDPDEWSLTVYSMVGDELRSIEVYSPGA